MSASKQVGINQVAQYICLFKKKKWHSMVENSGELAASELSLRIWFATTENCAKWKKKRQMRHRYNAESLRDPGYGQKYWAVVKRAWSLQKIVWWLWEDWYQPGSLWSDDKKKSIRIGFPFDFKVFLIQISILIPKATVLLYTNLNIFLPS